VTQKQKSMFRECDLFVVVNKSVTLCPSEVS